MEPNENPPSETQDPAAARSSSAPVSDEGPTPAWRVLAVILAVALVLAGAVMIAKAIDLLDIPLGAAACQASADCKEYFDGSSGERAVYVGLRFLSGGLAVVAALVATGFAVTGRGGTPMLWLTGAAVAFGAVTIAYGNLA